MKNNPFEQFDIEHLSASSINLYIQNTPLFIVRYLAKHKSPANAAMIRGTVIDHAIGNKTSIEDAQAEFKSLMSYEQSHGTVFDQDKADKEYNDIERYLSIGLPFYQHLGEPVSYQKKVEIDIGLPVPVIGYVDLEYQDCIRDIKTAAKKTSALLPPVQRQLAIYATALEKDHAYADYICVSKTSSEVITLAVDDISMRLDEVYGASSAMMSLLQNNDVNSLVDQFYPDLSHWMWTDSDKQVAKELWRIK